MPAPASAAPLVVYAAGDIAECRGKPPAESGAARTAKLIPPGATVLVPGDTAYPFATATTLQTCYEPTWGANRATTIAVPGNHDTLAMIPPLEAAGLRFLLNEHIVWQRAEERLVVVDRVLPWVRRDRLARDIERRHEP